MTDPVTAALDTIDPDWWTTTEHRQPLPQTSNPTVIAALLRLLDPQSGHRILEIGTGSGYSTALLAHTVGPEGRVDSLDIDPALTARARAKHHNAGHHHVHVHTADGHHGWPPSAPYDRIIAWTTPPLLPAPWVTQATTGGAIVTPIPMAEVAMAHAILHCHVTYGRPHQRRLHPGSFVDMTPDPAHPPTLPTHHIDATAPTEPPTWLSTPTLRHQPDTTAALATATPRSTLVNPTDRPSFTAYLLATCPTPASAGTRHGWGIGTATAHSIALVLTDGTLLTAGTPTAHHQLHHLHEQWRSWHRPSSTGYDRLTVHTTSDPDGWRIHPTLEPDPH